MLKIIGVEEVKTEALKADGYILSVRWNNLQPMHHIYLGVGNSNDMLIELGLSDLTHALGHFKIVIVPARCILSEEVADFSQIDLPIRQGVPICDWTWDKPSPYYVKEELDIHLFIGTEHLTVYLGEFVEFTEWIVAERVHFGIGSSNLLRAIQVFDLQPSEVANIKQAFPSS